MPNYTNIQRMTGTYLTTSKILAIVGKQARDPDRGGLKEANNMDINITEIPSVLPVGLRTKGSTSGRTSMAVKKSNEGACSQQSLFYEPATHTQPP